MFLAPQGSFLVCNLKQGEYAVMLRWMQQKYELIIVLHGDTEITNASTSLLSSYLHRSLLSALVAVRFGPLFTLACWRDFVVTAQGAAALLFLATYFIEGCNHLGNSENLVFRFSLLLYHTATDKSLLHITAGLTDQPGFGFISQISSCWKTIFLALFDECTTFWMSQSKPF